MTASDLVLVGSYDYRAIALSVLIAISVSHCALELGGRVTGARGGTRLSWLIGGATAMGIGIWSMHYVGMLAFRLPVPVQYDWPTALLSLLTAIFTAASSLFVVSRQTMGSLRTWASGILMGGAIAILHYTAMASMRLQAMCRHSPALVTLSVLLAIGFSLLSLWLTFFFRDEASGRRLRKGASALLMGTAISAMHYTGMASATFIRSDAAQDLSYAVSISSLAAATIGIVTLMVLEMALLVSLVDRLDEQRALLNELFEEAPQAVALMNVNIKVTRVNREFTRIFGYTPQEAIGHSLTDLIVPEDLLHEVERHKDLVAHGKRVDTESIRQGKDGSRLDTYMLGVPVSAPGGQIAVYAIYLDITARKRAEKELQHSVEQLRELAARLQSAREEERKRVAREIHDELGQSLTAIKFDVASLIGKLPSDRQRQPEAQSILKLVDQTIESMRRLATDLRPGILDDLGLVAAVEWEAGEFEARTRIKCRLDLTDGDISIDQERATAIFRILQETLTNVARHANATQVGVKLGKENGNLVLEVCDNGRGIGSERLLNGRSLGILGMRERALLLGGELTIGGATGKGTLVSLRIPALGTLSEQVK